LYQWKTEIEIGSFSERLLLVQKVIKSAESYYIGDGARKDGHSDPIYLYYLLIC